MGDLVLRKLNWICRLNEEEIFEKLTSYSYCNEENNGQEIGFPQLKSCGGIEIMICLANSRDLTVLDCSLVASDLKSHLAGEQSKLYIRPIQKNLSTKSILKESVSFLKENCINCGASVLVKELRNHVRSCTRDRTFLICSVQVRDRR